MADWRWCVACPSGGFVADGCDGAARCLDCGDGLCLSAEQRAQAHEGDEWVAANTRACPNCSVPIEKSGGCSHMTCAACSHEFCW